MLHSVLPYVLCVILFAIGLYAIAVKKNLIKVIVGVIIIHNAINLFLVLIGYRVPLSLEPIAPIITPQMGEPQEAIAQLLSNSVDPVPQALVLTSIVIGLSVVALMVVMALRLHQKYGTFDMTQITKLKG
ncbi:MAG: NADH-quinone oxidoreductase subunit K [Candidatus Brocadiae bacterium]|nr:NADH-quinone oxidoreductase subunit K [Candidatus Brocadiia bacterium]